MEGKFVVQVACGSYHSMALPRKGCVFTWGRGVFGRLGHGSETNCTIPCIVDGLDGCRVVKIAPFHNHSVALVSFKQRLYAKKMKAMVNDESCSDAVFILGNGDRVHAIKGLLIGQSEHFRAMFRFNMRERSRENHVEVGDCSKDVFLLLLEYLYTGRVDIGMDHALELYVLADQYQENGLSRKCLEVIERGLSHENVIRILVEVDAGLGLDAVKDVCISYVVSNFGKVMKFEAIDSLSHSLRGELLTVMSQKDPYR